MSTGERMDQGHMSSENQTSSAVEQEQQQVGFSTRGGWWTGDPTHGWLRASPLAQPTGFTSPPHPPCIHLYPANPLPPQSFLAKCTRTPTPSSWQALSDIISLLVSAGYFRARIAGLSDFDKVIGGLCWCITNAHVELDVDILFQENSKVRRFAIDARYQH